jgi:hypothetical protein
VELPFGDRCERIRARSASVITRTGRLPLGCLPVGRQVRPTVDRKAPRGLKNPLRRAAYARSPKGHLLLPRSLLRLGALRRDPVVGRVTCGSTNSPCRSQARTDSNEVVRSLEVNSRKPLEGFTPNASAPSAGVRES